MNRQEVISHLNMLQCLNIGIYRNTDYTALLHLGYCHPTHENTLKARGYVQSFQFLQDFSNCKPQALVK